MKLYATKTTQIGSLTIGVEDGKVTDLLFGSNPTDSRKSDAQADPLLVAVFSQLNEYFEGKRRTFDLPLAPEGTPFQLSVWKALQTIPYGETRSYRDIAIQVGNPKAARAVGGANHHNPIAIIIPCHRVIAADGSLGGFGGGLPLKEFLLDLERKNA
jgi:methylated-DNA-[protein]-cysteine S-methyltransferase